MEGRLPTTGEEYLRMVREQAKAFPTVVVAQASSEVRSAKNTSARYRTEWQSLQPAPEGCTPSTAWQDSFLVQYEQDKKQLAAYRSQANAAVRNRANPRGDVASESLSHDINNKQRAARDEQHNGIDIQNERKEVRERREQMGSDNIPNESSTRSKQRNPMKLPRVSDEQGWHRFLYGSSAEGQNIPGHAPSPAILMRLHQGQVIQLLHYHTKWLSSDNLSDREGQWLYALFLRLDPLVESDEVSILRSVAKKCALIRSHMTRESGSKLASVNMVITLVARVYGQADML